MSVHPLLVGIAKAVPGVFTFVTPVFTSLTHQFCIQRIHHGRVVGFDPVSVGAEFELLQTDLHLAIDGDPLYGFQLSDCIHVVGSGSALLRVLVKFVKGQADSDSLAFTRATTSAIIRFAAHISVQSQIGSPTSEIGNFYRRLPRSLGTRFDPTNSLPIAVVPDLVLGSMDKLDDFLDLRAAATPVTMTGSAKFPRTRALVVDDSATVRRATERLLQNVGIDVLTAKDGVAALEVLKDYSPDVILLDIEMPRMDGYAFARRLKGDDRLSSIPLVFVTSVSTEKSHREANELGVAQYVHKPFHQTQLLKAIETVVPLVSDF